MKVGVPKETAQGERRVALVPDLVSKLDGIEVVVEQGAGAAASFTDYVFTDASPPSATRGPRISSPRCASRVTTRWASCATGRSSSASSSRSQTRKESSASPRAVSRPSRWESIPASRGPSRWTALVPGDRRRLQAVAARRRPLPRPLPMLMTAAGTLAGQGACYRGGLAGCRRSRPRGAWGGRAGFDVRRMLRRVHRLARSSASWAGRRGGEGGYERELPEDEQRRQEQELEPRSRTSTSSSRPRSWPAAGAAPDPQPTIASMGPAP